MLLSGLTNNISSLNLVVRETLDTNLSLSVSINSYSFINITLITSGEIKLKIKDLKLFYGERSKYKSFIY